MRDNVTMWRCLSLAGCMSCWCWQQPSGSQLFLKLSKSHQIFCVHNINISCEVISKFCTEHGSKAAMLCVRFQNDFTTEILSMINWNFQELNNFLDCNTSSWFQPNLTEYRLFHSPLKQPQRQALACHYGCAKGPSLGSEKRWELPLVTWAHNAMGH